MLSTVTRTRALRTLAAVVASTVVVAACAAERHMAPISASTIEYILQVRTADGSVTANYIDEVPPAASGSAVSASLPPLIIVGGSSPVTVTRAEPFQQVILNVNGYQGYYALDLPAPVTSVDIVVSWQQDMPRLNFNTRAGSPDGGYVEQQTQAMRVGTGDVQVSVVFDSASDVDIHVTEPSGEKVYYGNSTSETGGRLDLDANAACSIPARPVNAENITWERGRAPRGEYKVELDWYSACGRQSTMWVVTVHRRGQPLQTFSGRFNANGTTPTRMVLITNFTF